MIVYAVVVLIAAAFGLSKFWEYMDAYEASRVKNTMEAYMAELTPQYICDRSGELIDSIDHGLQSEEACAQVIMDFLSTNISYARKSSECTDTRTVYMLRTRGRTIGKVELVPQGEERYGFRPWVVSEDSFDLSFLIGNQAAITVDSTMQVYAGTVLLDEGYVTATALPYAAVKDLYGEANLPYKMTYTAGPILGELTLHAVDAGGNTVEINEESDLDPYLDNCTEPVVQEVDTFMRDFVRRYTRYLTSRIDTRQENYQKLRPLLLSGSSLSQRISKAYEGLEYGHSKSDTITDIRINHTIDLGDGKYLCDVSYEADTLGKDGVLHHSINNAWVFLVRTSNGLKAERLISY
jgi:hypothetical protein